MKVEFIGQGYNLNKNTSVFHEIKKLLLTSHFTSFKCLVAFATRSGVSSLTPYILKAKDNIIDFQIIVGIDDITTYEALKEILSWNVKSYIYHFQSNSSVIFHPKIYMFEGKEKSHIIIGSNNMTQTGLVQSIEASSSIELDLSHKADLKFIDSIYNYFDPIFKYQDQNLELITEELLEKLLEKGKIPTEKEIRNRYKENRNSKIKTKDSDQSIFPPRKIQPLPKEFRSKTSKVSSPEQTYDNKISQIDTSKLAFYKQLVKNDVSLTSSPGQMIIPIKFLDIFPTFSTVQRKPNGASQREVKFDVHFQSENYNQVLNGVRSIYYVPSPEHPRKNKELRFTLLNRNIHSTLNAKDLLVFYRSTSEDIHFIVKHLKYESVEAKELLKNGRYNFIQPDK
ncbi:HKD family nuclease [Zunongwangia mangrovi]|uniref:HKD family nuclease n=1 Tax=Zunongwangia mangrovi TaxID=1334022 RepID=A0A1I1DMP9_9FLAO|nr:restriction endonuclease PLD domain-containing protein [Zunongwangia mangrovi]SFB75642.1 HKD family nuclease [Zunongwangia mangrovi]